MITLLLLGLVRGASSEWAVVTGASSGIGEQLALQAAQRGYDVVLHGRRRRALHRLKKAIEAQTNRRTKMVIEDLSRRNGAKRLHAACRDLDVRLLFANAGVARVKPFIEDDVDAMLALNVCASTDLCRRFGRDMAEAGGGRVVNVTLDQDAVLGHRADRVVQRRKPAAAVHRYIYSVTKAKEQRIVDQRQQLADVVRRAAERVQGHRKTWRRLDGPERGFQGGVLLDGVHGGRPPEPRGEFELRVEDGSLLR